MITTNDITEQLKLAWAEGCKAQITANNRTGWNQADSAEALLALSEGYHDALMTIDADGQPDAEANKLRDTAKAEFKRWAYELANPSAFRQFLEKAKKITPKPEGAKGTSAKASAASLL